MRCSRPTLFEQIDGLPEHYYAPANPEPNPDERIGHAEDFFAALGADIRYGGGSAHYVPSLDYIQMPPFEAFVDADRFYSTLGHEVTHWSGHESRLDRGLGRGAAGRADYAKEELIAELGAAFLCADLGIKCEDRENHAAYIGSWARILKDEKRAIFTAAAHAQKAVDYLHGLQDREETAPAGNAGGKDREAA